MPEVSVIIPNYDHARFLEQRIGSILAQTFEDFEVIILDDCSKDESRAIIETYRSHPRIAEIIYNDKNSGSPFLQWQKGIALAKGSYIWIAESDDYCDSRFLETCMQGLARHSDASLVYTNSRIVDDNGLVVHEDLQWWVGDIDGNKWRHDYHNQGDKEIREALAVKNTIPNASAVVFKKQFFEEVTRFRYAGDWLFWIRVLENGNLVFINESLNSFRSHGLTTRNYASMEKKRSFLKEKAAVISYLWEKGLLSNEKWTKHKAAILREWITLFTVRGVFSKEFFIPFDRPGFLIGFISHKISGKLKR